MAEPEHFLRMQLPSKSFRRSVQLRRAAEEFSKMKTGHQHFSLSGATAIIFAEKVMEGGRGVSLQIRRSGVILTILGREDDCE